MFISPVNSIYVNNNKLRNVNSNQKFSNSNNHNSTLTMKALYPISFSGFMVKNNEKLIKNKNFEEYGLNKIIDCIALKHLGIPNLRIIENKGVRGETLSSSRNFKFLPLVKDCGINTIIDLRTSDFTPKFKEKCDLFGLNYFHIPIDKNNVADREILQKLPKLFELIERGKFYIACAQGKHRTDIALAINYAFNPKQKIPPFMAGHTSFHTTDMADINRRLNSLYKNITLEDRIKLGWPADYDDEFIRKKRVLKTFSENYEEPKYIY